MAWSLFSSNPQGSGDIPKQDTFDKLIPSYSSDGVSFAAQSKRTDWLSDPLSMSGDLELASFLSQLEEQGVVLSWGRAHQVKKSAVCPLTEFGIVLSSVTHCVCAQDKPHILDHGLKPQPVVEYAPIG
jgi:hypothetical protein